MLGEESLGLGPADVAVEPRLLAQRQQRVHPLRLGVQRAAAQIQLEVRRLARGSRRRRRCQRIYERFSFNNN